MGSFRALHLGDLSYSKMAERGYDVLNYRDSNHPQTFNMRLIGGPLNNKIVRVSIDTRLFSTFRVIRRSGLDRTAGGKTRHVWLPVGPKNFYPNEYSRNERLIDGKSITRFHSYTLYGIGLSDSSPASVVVYGSHDQRSKRVHCAATETIYAMSALNSNDRVRHDMACVFGTCSNKGGRGYNTYVIGDTIHEACKFVGGELGGKIYTKDYAFEVAPKYGYEPHFFTALGHEVCFFLPKGHTLEYAFSRRFGT